MYKKSSCSLRILLFSTLFLLVMIQRVTSFLEKFNSPYFNNSYGDMSAQYGKINPKMASTTQRRISDSSFNERSQFQDQSSRIVFPTDDLPPTKSQSMMVPSCNGTLCENVKNYPAAEIKSLIVQSENVKLLGGIDIVNLDISQRVDLSEDLSLCESDVRVMYPKSGFDENSKWFFIVNVENFTQAVTVEVCRNEGNQCNYISSNVIDGYRTFCKQNYITQKLATFAHDRKSISRQSFKLPAGCCCHVKYVGNDRM